MQRVSLKVVFREKELWILVLLGILFFYRPLFLEETFFFRDLSSNNLPPKQIFVDFIQNGELPLWDAYLYGGKPYLADLGNSTFNPFNLLYCFLPLFRAFNLSIILHFICGSVFAYLFSRIIGLQPVSSFIVGVVYGFCGYTLSLANLPGLLVDIPYLPLLLVFWHLFLSEKKRKWFVIAIIVGGIQMVNGSHELNAVTFLILLGWSVFYPYPSSSTFRKITLGVLLGIFIVGIALVQIIPTGEMLLQSSRIEVAYNEFSAWSLHPNRLPELLFPDFLIYVDPLFGAVHYWGEKIVDGQMPFILSIYFGWAVLILAVLGGLYRGDNSLVPFKVRLFLFLFFILSLFFSLGRFLPFFGSFYRYISLITLSRYPSRLLIAGIFPIALLAGYGSEVCFGGLRNKEQETRGSCSSNSPIRISDPKFGIWSPSLKFLSVFCGISLILILFTTAFLLSSDFANRFQEIFFKHSGGEIARRGLGISLKHTSAICFLMVLLYLYRRLKRSHWQHWIIACILAVDLLFAGRNVNPSAPEALFTSIPPVVPVIRNEIGEGRLFRSDRLYRGSLRVPSYDMMWVYRSYFEALSERVPVFYRIPIIFHDDPDRFTQKHMMKLKIIIDSLPWEHRLPLLSAGGVTVILTSERLSIPGIRRIAEIPNRSEVPFYLYRNETAAARVEFVTSWKMANSDIEAIQTMRHPNYDPRHYVVLQEPGTTFSLPFFGEGQVKDDDSSFSIGTEQQYQYTDVMPQESSSFRIKKLQSNTHSAQFSVFTNRGGFLVFSEPFYPGWHVTVNGKSVPVLRANLAFSAIFLPAGNHEIRRYYRPGSVIVGILGSLFSCVVLVFITYKGWFLNIH